jgi:outer membrane protein TolC
MGRAALAATAAAWAVALAPGNAGAEDLRDAWGIALRVNQGLQAQQAQVGSAERNAAAARSARLPQVSNFTFNSFLSNSPAISTKGVLPAAATGAGAGGLGAALPGAFPILGSGQTDFPFSVTYATVPIYTFGRIRQNIDAARHQQSAQQTEVSRSALDLKLTVAEAYIGVLRARRQLEVARSDVVRLVAFARDVINRREQGLAIRSDELAAEVSLANARVREIQARNALTAAWATYNRYVCRPLTATADLTEIDINIPAARLDLDALAAGAAPGITAAGEGEVRDLTALALRARPELAGFVEQARALDAQAAATLGNIRPVLSFNGAFVYLGNERQLPQGIGAATFLLTWNLSDGGASRRRAAGLRFQESAALKRRADAAADIALQVRTRWLDLDEARRRLAVAKAAIALAEENLNVVTDRYRQQLSTYTEVLDAETRRVQALTNLYDANYDTARAFFRLRRAVGDI